MPQPASQRTRQGESSRSRRNKDDDKPPKQTMNIPAPDTLEQNIDNPEPIVDVDVNEDLNVGQDTKDDDNLSLIAKEVINVSPEIMPIIVDKLMDKIMPKVMNKLGTDTFSNMPKKQRNLRKRWNQLSPGWTIYVEPITSGT